MDFRDKLDALAELRPSEILKLALYDLETCEHDSAYVVDMDYWVQPIHNDTCAVCLAGALLVRSVRVNPHDPPGNKKLTSHPVVQALDRFREGHIKLGLRCLRHEHTHSLVSYMNVPNYDADNPEPFKTAMRVMIQALAVHGL